MITKRKMARFFLRVAGLSLMITAASFHGSYLDKIYYVLIPGTLNYALGLVDGGK